MTTIFYTGMMRKDAHTKKVVVEAQYVASQAAFGPDVHHVAVSAIVQGCPPVTFSPPAADVGGFSPGTNPVEFTADIPASCTSFGIEITGADPGPGNSRVIINVFALDANNDVRPGNTVMYEDLVAIAATSPIS